MTAIQYPESKKTNVIDSYHGIEVTDHYRWLEDAQDPEVRAWTRAQNQLSRAFLDQIPGRQDFYERLSTLYRATSAIYYNARPAAGSLFVMKMQPPKQQPFLVRLTDLFDAASERTVVDPNVLDPSGRTAMDFYVPSPDGSRVAVCLSLDGSEDGSVHVFDGSSGKTLGDVVPRVNYPTGGGSVAWDADSAGFYYTRYPHAGERLEEDLNFYQQVWHHRLGAPLSEDTYVIGEQFPRIAEIELHATEDGSRLFALVLNGDGGDMNHYLRLADGSWRQVTRFEDHVKRAAWAPDGSLYLLSREGAPRGKILRLPPDCYDLKEARLVLPEQPGAIESFEVTETGLYVVELDGGPSRLRMFDRHGNELADVPLEPISTVWEQTAWRGDAILYRSASYLTPMAWYLFDPAVGEPQKTAIFVTSLADFSDCTVEREFAISRDGTRVPVNIIHRKDLKRDGGNPLLMIGYGGYGVSMRPGFIVRFRIWLDMGGIVVIANLRGGGEYGEAWHMAGNLTNKQNVFDDFIGCAEHLIARQYTRPDRLCIEGGSNGGLLMGAALTQRPELFKAVVSHVGIYDMLRVELDPNGAFNVTEFGTVDNPQQFEALYDYSPYHRVVDGTAYPAVLLTTGEHDGRVNPAESRKMAARLQAATSSDQPVLLRTNEAGHGIGTALDERISEEADVFAFLKKYFEME
jgi:prolyl oligopeptidase